MLANNVFEHQIVTEGAMGVDGGLEGHDGFVGCDGVRNLFRDVEDPRERPWGFHPCTVAPRIYLWVSVRTKASSNGSCS